ncbi:MAG TPA: penicillin-binding protein 2 [Spirochaetota bacterium]|nr:penicillin-binding protein 2 [Spirochaetota bacterium]HPI88714.1 penicillin-binding protein 2 [Spirochaetota bacterium]HPR48764.1 penicillin-binding protein 2 [Spirochaetota bacterium]
MQTSLKARMLEAFRFRMYFFSSVVAFIFFILIIQLINLQIIQGSEYELKSRLNMENYIPIPASRGEIYDRNYSPGGDHKVLVSNRPSFNITMIPANYATGDDLNLIVNRVARLLKIQTEDIREQIKSGTPWERIVLKEDVDFDTIVKIASNQHLFPKIEWEDAPLRVYNTTNIFAHSIGYIGTISREEYASLKKKGYKHYQKIGKTGIERQYDALLRGNDGFIRRIVDVRNRTEGEEVGLRPTAGNNIVLTIDYDVQKAAFDAMTGMNGSAIVLKPATGEVLALVSKPDYDPNMIMSRDNEDFIKELNTDPNRPFLNRTIQSKYPPASTFKLVTAVAGLETEKTYPEKTFYCPGKYTLKGYIDRDFYCYEAHGTVNLYWAIARSCSVYFYQLGYKIGPTSILKYAEYFGLNEKSNIDIPGEISGFIPTKNWKMKVFGQPWFDGDTLNLSIGQGFLTITPIAMANFIAGLVNNGIVYRPHLLKEVRSPDNRIIVQTQAREKIREIPLSPLTLKVVKEGMRLGVTSGTSARLNWLKVPVAGKTGTAQTRSKRKSDATQHGWFVGYAPYNGSVDKAVAVVVMVEYGIAGAVSAVPVAERVFSTLYEKGYFQ